MSIADTLLEGSNGDYSSEQEEIRKGVIEKLQAFEDVNANLEGRKSRTVKPMLEYTGDREVDNVGGLYDPNPGYSEYIYVSDNNINGFEYNEYVRAKTLNIVAHEGVHVAQDDFVSGELVNEKQYMTFCGTESADLMMMANYPAMQNSYQPEDEYYKENYGNMPEEVTARNGAAYLSKQYCAVHPELEVSEAALDKAAENAEIQAMEATSKESVREKVWEDMAVGKSAQKANVEEFAPVDANTMLTSPREDPLWNTVLTSGWEDAGSGNKHQERQDTMNDAANEAATPENRSSNEEGIGQQQDTMRNVADQAALPENAPSNGQEEGQAQARGNTMSM